MLGLQWVDPGGGVGGVRGDSQVLGREKPRFGCLDSFNNVESVTVIDVLCLTGDLSMSNKNHHWNLGKIIGKINFFPADQINPKCHGLVGFTLYRHRKV